MPANEGRPRPIPDLLTDLLIESRRTNELLAEFLKDWRAVNQPSTPTATHAVLKVQGGQQMPGSITVDTTNETVTVEFEDDKGDTDATAPIAASGAALVVTFVSDNPSVATVNNDAGNTLQGDITPVGEGTANISASLAYADGTPVLEADGQTAFPDPTAVQVTVSAGAAVGDSLVLSV